MKKPKYKKGDAVILADREFKYWFVQSAYCKFEGGKWSEILYNLSQFETFVRGDLYCEGVKESRLSPNLAQTNSKTVT